MKEKFGMRVALLLIFITLILPIFSLAKLAKRKSHPPIQRSVSVHQEADQLQYDDKLKLIHLNGHVKLWEEKIVLEANQAVYNLKTQQAEAQGNVKMTGPEGTLTGNHLLVFYREKRAVVDGNVVLNHTLTEKKGSGEIISNGLVTVTANQLEYLWGEKTATANGSVTIAQKGNKAFADHAVYDESTNQVSLNGNVRLFRPAKDELLCDRLHYNLTNDEAIAEGHVKGNFVVKQVLSKPLETKPSESEVPHVPEVPAPESPSTPQPPQSP